MIVKNDELEQEQREKESRWRREMTRMDAKWKKGAARIPEENRSSSFRSIRVLIESALFNFSPRNKQKIHFYFCPKLIKKKSIRLKFAKIMRFYI